MVNKLSVGMSLTGSGLKDWLVQRFSSLIIALYFLVILGFFSSTQILIMSLYDISFLPHGCKYFHLLHC